MDRNQDQEFAELIEEHLPLVRHIVFQVSVRYPQHVDREELARAGVLGLVQAARRFDADKGVPFARFAAQRIRGAILDSVRSMDWAPRSLRRSARTLETATANLAGDLGRAPTSAETAAALGMTVNELADLQEQLSRSVVLTLDMALAETGDDEEITLGSTAADAADGAEEQLETRELHAYLHDAVVLLPERLRFVISGYFFEGLTSEEIATALGVSVSRVSQLRSDAFALLRDGLTAQFPASVPSEPALAVVAVAASSSSSSSSRSASASASTQRSRVAERRATYAAAIAGRRGWKARLAGEDASAVDVSDAAGVALAMGA
jgi:RNA polymerase sigma factor for flagellar operon FliA